MIVGGGDRPESAMAKFVEWAGGAKANILVIPWATEEPQESFEYLKKDLVTFNPAVIALAPARPRWLKKPMSFLHSSIKRREYFLRAAIR